MNDTIGCLLSGETFPLYVFLELKEYRDDAEWKILDEAKFGELGCSQRMRRKIEKIKHFTREAAKVTASPQEASDVLSLRKIIETMRRDVEVTYYDN